MALAGHPLKRAALGRPPPRRLALRFVDSVPAASPGSREGVDGGEGGGGSQSEELIEIEISNHDAHSSAHTLRAAVVLALLDEFGSEIDPATVELQLRSAGKGWSRWRPPSEFAELSETDSEVRLCVHPAGSAQALRARSQWQSAQKTQLGPEATEDEHIVETDEDEIAFTQVSEFLGALGSARFASPAPDGEDPGAEPAVVILARRCCSSLDEFGTRPSEWLDTLKSMPLETLVEFVGACEVQQPSGSSSLPTAAHGYQMRSAAASARSSSSVSWAPGGWSFGGAATSTSSLVPCKLVLCSSRGALVMYAEPSQSPTPAVPETDVVAAWAGWLHGWRALVSSPSESPVVRHKWEQRVEYDDRTCTASDPTPDAGLEPAADPEQGRPRYRYRTAAEIGRIHFEDILHCCVLEDKKPVPPPLQCKMPPHGYPHQQRCASTHRPCQCTCRWACLQAGRCRTAAQRGELGIIEHFPCCEMGRCHILCPVAAATRGQAILEPEPLHALHLVLSSQPAAESAVDAVPGDFCTERTLLVSGEGGLLLATQLQELVSAQRDGST